MKIKLQYVLTFRREYESDVFVNAKGISIPIHKIVEEELHNITSGDYPISELIEMEDTQIVDINIQRIG